ncbi:MAG: hypothetical protein KDB23_30435, partial [Planctomycetales bacterium]|nr:hypothetical protein [Planctomycetales bacterium]
DVIIASECSEGLGSPEFIAAQRRLVTLGADVFVESLLSKRHAEIDEWQSQLQVKAEHAGVIHLYAPRLDAQQHALTGVERVEDIATAIDLSFQRHGSRRLAVIPEGPYLVPHVRRALAND